jgi:hypothetical protein
MRDHGAEAVSRALARSGRLLIGAALAATLCACSAAVRHPPSYADIVAVGIAAQREPEQAALREQEVREALAFAEKDIARLSSSGDATLIAAAAAQLDAQNRHGDDMLTAAEELEPQSALVLLTWIDRQLLAGFDRPLDEARDAKLRARLRLLHERMPENSLPLYVAAYGKLRHGDTAAALEAMQVGRKMKGFDSGSRERFAAIASAAEVVGYSPFTARYHAMGLFVPTGTYSALRRLCAELVSGPNPHEGRVECVLLGHAIETSSWNMLERAVGLGLQASAWEGVQGPEAVQARAEISRRWLELKNRENLPALSDLSEETWLEYFRIFAASGEEAAMRYAVGAVPSS